MVSCLSAHECVCNGMNLVSIDVELELISITKLNCEFAFSIEIS